MYSIKKAIGGCNAATLAGFGRIGLQNQPPLHPKPEEASDFFENSGVLPCPAILRHHKNAGVGEFVQVPFVEELAVGDYVGGRLGGPGDGGHAGDLAEEHKVICVQEIWVLLVYGRYGDGDEMWALGRVRRDAAKHVPVAVWGETLVRERHVLQAKVRL